MSPKAIIKQEKRDAVKMLSDAFKAAHSTTLIDYTGMNVRAMQDLRSKLTDAGARILIAKNTLVGIAAKDAGQADVAEGDTLTGQTAIIFASEDPIAPIQVIGKFNKETELGSFKAGVVEGVFHGKDSIVKISMLPSREELYAQVVGAVSSPLYGLTSTLQTNLTSLVFILDQRSKQLT
jgi:large subunit ribosomal protein L10